MGKSWLGYIIDGDTFGGGSVSHSLAPPAVQNFHLATLSHLVWR